MNKIISDDSKIKFTKGNIPIYEYLLNKYTNVSELMNCNIDNYDGKVNIFDDLEELRNVELNTMGKSDLYHLATIIFIKYNNRRMFVNVGNEIIVSNGDIKESVNKIVHNIGQLSYLREHLLVFSDLVDIIESAVLTGQTVENKNREDNNIWNYYLNGLKINGKVICLNLMLFLGIIMKIIIGFNDCRK